MAQAALAETPIVVAPTPAPVPPPAPRYRLNVSEFQSTMHSGHDWTALVRYDVPIEAVLTDEFWTHIPSTHPVQVGQLIRAMCVDLSYFLLLWVVDKGPNYLRVDPIIVHQREAQTSVGGRPEASGFKVEWKGLSEKFTVIRTSDSKPIKKGFKTEGAAWAWVAEHNKAFTKK